MTDSAQLLTDFRRYADLIRSSLASARTPISFDSENATAVQVERGIIYPLALLDQDQASRYSVDRLIELSRSDRLPSLAVIDRSGHHRPVYRGLLVYSWLKSFQLLYETLPRAEFGKWEEGLRPWCDLLEAELGEIDWPVANAPMPAGRGSSATEAAWMALTLHVAGKVYIRDAWTDLASDTFGKLVLAQSRLSPSPGTPGEGRGEGSSTNSDAVSISRQNPHPNPLPEYRARENSHGQFLLATASDNPETHWYHELVLLHAAASYAVQAEDRTVAAAVERNAQFHQNEIQPDHASTQPWGLFAFIWNSSTRPLADQILHGASVQDSTISLMLLADALYCLELFTK